MKRPWVAAVVMGCGVPGDTSLDKRAMKRVYTAIKVYCDGKVAAIILTGTKSFISLATKEITRFVRFDRILIPESFENYTCDTPGDVLQAVKVARANTFTQLLVVTEEPHFRYRVKDFFFKLGPEMKPELLSAGKAEPWYWVKEFGSHLILYLGSENSFLYRNIRLFWKFFAEKRYTKRKGMQ